MSLKKDLLKGAGYTAISKYIGIVISLVITAVLARLLSPSDFGTIAIAMVIITFFGVFSDLGIAPAIIQKKDLEANDLSTLFTFTVYLAIVFSLSFFAVSGLIASYYDSPVLAHICRLLSLSLFFNTVNIVPNALLYKEKEFRFLAVRNLVVQSIVGAIAILAAILGAGMYALIINPIFSAAIMFIISYRRYPQQFLFTKNFDAVKQIFSYSSYQFLFNLINYFSRNLDKLFIGKYLNMDLLGYYEKSYRLMMLPLQNITQVISPVMHPIFSDFQNDLKMLESSYLKIVRLLAFIGFPLSVFLFFTSKELVLLFFGMQWELSVPVFKILALTVGIQVVLSSSGSIFQAAGDTKSLFIAGLFSAILNVVSISVGVFVFKTLEAVAWGLVISFSINFIQCYMQMYYVTFRLGMKQFVATLLSPLLLSFLVFLVLFVSTRYIVVDNMILSLIFKGFLWSVVYVAYIQLMKEYDIIKMIKNRMLK